MQVRSHILFCITVLVATSASVVSAHSYRSAKKAAPSTLVKAKPAQYDITWTDGIAYHGYIGRVFFGAQLMPLISNEGAKVALPEYIEAMTLWNRANQVIAGRGTVLQIWTCSFKHTWPDLISSSQVTMILPSISPKQRGFKLKVINLGNTRYTDDHGYGDQIYAGIQRQINGAVSLELDDGVQFGTVTFNAKITSADVGSFKRKIPKIKEQQSVALTGKVRIETELARMNEIPDCRGILGIVPLPLCKEGNPCMYGDRSEVPQHIIDSHPITKTFLPKQMEQTKAANR
jgi:hypothetical protein